MRQSRWGGCARSSSRSLARVYLPGKPGIVRFGQGGAIRGPKPTRIPDFDRLVRRSGHDLGPVWGKRHRADVVAVGARLLGLQLQSGCEGRQEWSVLAKGRRLEAQNAPESQTLIVWDLCMPHVSLLNVRGRRHYVHMPARVHASVAYAQGRHISRGKHL